MRTRDTRFQDPASVIEDGRAWRWGEPVRVSGLGVTLRSLVPADLDDAFMEEMRDPRITQNLAVAGIAGRMSRAELARALGEFDNRRLFFLGVWPRGHPQRRIGFCQARLDGAGVAVLTAAITDPALWRHGAVRAAVVLLRAFLFELVGVHKMSARAYADNTAAITALEEYGWVREGVLREAESDGAGGRRDLVLYGMLRAEHLAGKPAKPFVLPPS